MINLRAILLVSLFLGSSAVSEVNTIYWQTSHRPPEMILHGELKGQGKIDRLFRLVMKELEHYQHHFVQMNWKRAFVQIQQRQNVCVLTGFKLPERQKFAHFSDAVLVTLPHRIITRKQVWQRLGEPVDYDIRELFEDSRFTGGIRHGNSYSPRIDRLIENHMARPKRNLVKNDVDRGKNIELLLHKRIDYTLEFPTSVVYATREMAGAEDIRSIGIKGLPSHIVAHAACPKTPWGQRVISDINRVLPAIKARSEYQDILEDWAFEDDKALLRSFDYDAVTIR